MTNPTRKDDPIEFHRGAFKQKLRQCLGGASGDLSGVMEDLDAAVKQAREDTFNVARNALKSIQTDDRWTFLQYCLNGWPESGATGFLIVEYDPGLSNYDLAYTPGLPEGTKRREARIVAINQGDEHYDDRAVKMVLDSGKVCRHCGTPLTQKDGTWVDRTNAYACPSKEVEHEPEQALFEITHETIELGLQRIRHATDVPDEGPHSEQRNLTSVKYLGRGLRDAIIEADLTHEAGQLDVWGYTMIVEVALFGQGMYS